LRYRLPPFAAAARPFPSRQAASVRVGPGETQLEVDRRRIMRKITKLEVELEAVRQRAVPNGASAGEVRFGRCRSSGTPTAESRRC